MDYRDVLEVSEYKGKPVLTIPTGYNQNFSFGFQKAVILTAHEAELRAFVRTQGKSADNPSVVISEYKGHPILELKTSNPKYPLRLGLAKAAAVVQYICEIAEFVLDHEEDYLGRRPAPTKEQIEAQDAEYAS